MKLNPFKNAAAPEPATDYPVKKTDAGFKRLHAALTAATR
mgnify:CR=1 FL=1